VDAMVLGLSTSDKGKQIFIVYVEAAGGKPFNVNGTLADFGEDFIRVEFASGDAHIVKPSQVIKIKVRGEANG
jgi:hypothetical protein